MGKLVTRFERLLAAMNIVSAADDSAFKKTAIDMRRLALQLHYAGPEVEVMHDTLPLEADLDKQSASQPNQTRGFVGYGFFYFLVNWSNLINR